MIFDIFNSKDKNNQLQACIERALALEKSNQIDEAEAAFHACLQLVTNKHIPLQDEQLLQIWMGIGFCYADRGDWRKALEYYHRVESFLLSTLRITPHAVSPESKADFDQWMPFLPEGVQVVHQRNFPTEEHLAVTYDSIALAYDNDNRPELSKDYFHRSIDLYKQNKNPASESKVYFHQAVGYQRREEWVDLELTAHKLLLASKDAQNNPLMLEALRFLSQSEVNQNRPFKCLEYLVQSINLARELNDAKLKRDESAVRDLINMLRPDVLLRSDVHSLAILVSAAKLLNASTFAQDSQLLKKWRNEQPDKAPPNSMIVGTLTSLSDVAIVLEHFGLRQCGEPTKTVLRKKPSLSWLYSNNPEIVKQQVWAVTQENFQVFRKEVNGVTKSYNTESISLIIFGQPISIIDVSLTASECIVRVLEERAVSGTSIIGYRETEVLSIKKQANELLKCLNGLIAQGIFIQRDSGLLYNRSNNSKPS